MIVLIRGRQVQREENLKIVDRLRALRETQIGAFIPVLLALVAIWGYFGLVIPLQDLLAGETENFRAIFLSPRKDLENTDSQDLIYGF